MIAVLLLLLLAGSSQAQEPERAIHHRLVQYYLPDESLEEALWPVARDSGLLGKVDDNDFRLRALYLGAYYSTPAGRAWAGAPPDPPATVKAPPPPNLPQVLKVTGDRIERTDGTIDYAIVGSGPAGCVAARVLTARGLKVVVVEAGSLYAPGYVDGRRISAFKDSRFTRNGSVLVNRGWAAGGGATVNVDLAFPPTQPRVRERFQRWGLNLPLEEGYAWVVDQLGTRPVDPSEINANNRVLWDGARALGLEPELYHLNTWRHSPYPATDKRSPVECLLLPAVKDGAGLLTDTEVTRIDGTELQLSTRTPWPGAWKDPSGLDLHGHYRLKARRVLLCAGALGTAALLQKSGIPCGSGVVLHPSIPVVGVYDHPIRNWEGTPASVFVARPDFILEAMSGGPEYVANLIMTFPSRTHELMRDYPNMAGFGVMLVDQARPENQVRADGTLDYDLSPTDRNRLADGVDLAIRIHFAAGAKRVLLPTREIPCVIERGEKWGRVHLEPGTTLVSSSHIQGSCKIGQVVNQHGQVLGHPDLYVLDSSLFPESVGVNPMQTIYTVAYLLSRDLP